MADDCRSSIVTSLMEQIIGFKKRIKSALANEAMLTKDLAQLHKLGKRVARGKLIAIDKPLDADTGPWPQGLDKLLDPIWEKCPATLEWWHWHMHVAHTHEKTWLVGGHRVWKEFVDLLTANLLKVEAQLATSVNEGARRWIEVHLEVLEPVYKD